MQDKPILTNDEMLALIKLILFIKFESQDSESLLFSGSESINSALQKLLTQHPFYQDKSANFFGKLPQEYLAIMLQKIEKEESTIQKMDEVVKQKLIENCVYPYRI